MTHSTIRRAALGVAAAFALAAPAAQADTGAAVCNQASPHFQGGGPAPA